MKSILKENVGRAVIAGKWSLSQGRTGQYQGKDIGQLNESNQGSSKDSDPPERSVPAYLTLQVVTSKGPKSRGKLLR